MDVFACRVNKILGITWMSYQSDISWPFEMEKHTLNLQHAWNKCNELCPLTLNYLLSRYVCMNDHQLSDRSPNTRFLKIPKANAWLNNKEGEMIFVLNECWSKRPFLHLLNAVSPTYPHIWAKGQCQGSLSISLFIHNGSRQKV